jgi:hypothetical protein
MNPSLTTLGGVRLMGDESLRWDSGPLLRVRRMGVSDFRSRPFGLWSESCRETKSRID